MDKRLRFVLIGLGNFLLFVLLVSVPIFWGDGTQFVSTPKDTYNVGEAITFKLTNLDITQCGCSEAPFIIQRLEDNTWQTLPVTPQESRVCIDGDTHSVSTCDESSCNKLSYPYQTQIYTWDQNLTISKEETITCADTDEELPRYVTVKVKKGQYRAVFGGNTTEFTIE